MTAILVDEAGVRAVADPADIRSRVGQGAFFWLDLVGGDRSARTAWLAELGFDVADIAWAMRFRTDGTDAHWTSEAAPLELLQIDEWDRMIDINIKGVLYGIAAALPYMKAQKSGHFINVSSVAGHKIGPGGMVYSATKHAVRGISEGLRQEVKPYNIRTTIISPGRSRPSYPTASWPPALRKRSTIFTRNMRSPPTA